MKTLFAPHEIEYTGEQLRSGWARDRFDVEGDAAVAFIGACDVRPEFMKDLEDLAAGSRIRSERMLHFIIEHFKPDLELATVRQHLFMARMADRLNLRLGRPLVTRRGSDLFDGARKLTVSVAGVSPVSGLIHAGINISSRNTPVPTRGLDDYGIEPAGFAAEMLDAYAEECESIRHAQTKVRPCS